MTNCKCGSNGCATRTARGLVPFCEMKRDAAPRDRGFGSYSAAETARQDGQRIVCVTRSGGPKTFALVVVTCTFPEFLVRAGFEKPTAESQS